MTRYRVVVEHVSSGRIWYGRYTEFDTVEYLKLEEMLQDTCDNGSFFVMTDADGDEIILPKNLIQECAFTIEESKEYD